MELKKYRRIAGLTQGQLAKKSGVDVTIICKLERGTNRSASYRNIVRLARTLNLEPEELVPVDSDFAFKPEPPTGEIKRPLRARRPRTTTAPSSATAR